MLAQTLTYTSSCNLHRFAYFTVPFFDSFGQLLLILLLLGDAHKSRDVIPKSLDKAMDRANPSTTNGITGISIRNGPMDEMDIDGQELNGLANNKRKARASTGKGKSYKEASDEENDEEKPLVRC